MTYLACQTDEQMVLAQSISLSGLWWSGLESFGEEDLQMGIGWQLSGIGLEPDDWDVNIQQVQGQSTYWVDLTINFPYDNSCFQYINSQLSSEWPFVVQLSQLTQNPSHVALFTDSILDFANWERLYSINQETLLLDSLIVSGQRSISFTGDATSISDIAYFAFALEHPEIIETIDVMPNGRLRYGQYLNGRWHAVSDLGSVARCQWCHEGKLLDLQTQTDFEGYTPYDAFSDTVSYHNELIRVRHDVRFPEENLLNLSLHAAGEILVEHYLNPNLKSLMIELDLDQNSVMKWLELAGIESHFHNEYPSWGEVYKRSEVNQALEKPSLIPMAVRDWDETRWPSFIPLEDCINGDG